MDDNATMPRNSFTTCLQESRILAEHAPPGCRMVIAFGRAIVEFSVETFNDYAHLCLDGEVGTPSPHETEIDRQLDGDLIAFRKEPEHTDHLGDELP
jgi:hypothetical protein